MRGLAREYVSAASECFQFFSLLALSPFFSYKEENIAQYEGEV